MSEAKHDIGQVKVFQAESIGVPGKRTFRLLVDASKGALSVAGKGAALQPGGVYRAHAGFDAGGSGSGLVPDGESLG